MPSKMDAENYANTIWAIAKSIRGTILPKDYNKLILPFSLLRRLECVLEPTRDAVLEAYEKHKAEWGTDNDNYCMSSEKAFYNLSSYRLADLGSANTEANLKAYIDAFSPNVREIFKQFDFNSIITKLQDQDEPQLYKVSLDFGSKSMDLSPEAVDDRTMSNIYEHLIRKFGEAIAEDAEDYMTPRDVVRLAVSLVMATGEDDILSSDNGVVRTIYDPTMGTGGFITDAMDYIEEVQGRKDLKVPAVVIPYGEEKLGETWAMGKTNLLIRNAANKSLDKPSQMNDLSAHIYNGNTLINDMTGDMRFDLIFSNPPFGQDWKKEKNSVEEEMKLGPSGRFWAGVPKISDSAMLFLQHVVYKMKSAEEGGAKAAIVLSASPLFTGDAGSGPSNIRRWLLEKDFIDCIVKLPVNLFYRTDIATYLWILSTKKEKSRKGLVQLIDASDFKTLLRRNQGKKRFEISDEDIQEIVRMYIDGSDHGRTVMVSWRDFCFRQVTVQRPLQRVIRITEEKLAELRTASQFSKLPENVRNSIVGMLTVYEDKDLPYEWPQEFISGIKGKFGIKTKPSPSDLVSDMQKVFSEYDENAPVSYDKKGNPIPDPDLVDTEDIPFDVAFDAYMDKNVHPYVKGAWIDESVKDKGPLNDHDVGVVGTEISFNRYFYKYEPPRPSSEIANEILESQEGFEEMFREILK